MFKIGCLSPVASYVIYSIHKRLVNHITYHINHFNVYNINHLPVASYVIHSVSASAARARSPTSASSDRVVSFCEAERRGMERVVVVSNSTHRHIAQYTAHRTTQLTAYTQYTHSTQYACLLFSRLFSRLFSSHLSVPLNSGNPFRVHFPHFVQSPLKTCLVRTYILAP